MQILVNEHLTTWQSFVSNNPDLDPEVLHKIKARLNHGASYRLHLGAGGEHLIEPYKGPGTTSARPWELKTAMIPIGDTGEHEDIAYLQVAGSNGGDRIVEIFNPEQQDLDNLRLIVTAVNAYQP